VRIKAVDLAKRLGISYRQLDYWLLRLGAPPIGSGNIRYVTPAMAKDIKAIIEIKRGYERDIEEILSQYSRPRTPAEAQGRTPVGDTG
jgi:DNA-binding transcriptional MerR regulator